jgi:hypothetical protein
MSGRELEAFETGAKTVASRAETARTVAALRLVIDGLDRTPAL